jgi:hypothetical protein
VRDFVDRPEAYFDTRGRTAAYPANSVRDFVDRLEAYFCREWADCGAPLLRERVTTVWSG